MSALLDALSRRAGLLLLDILDQQQPVISSGALRDHVPAPGQELLNIGLLLPHGSEMACSEGDVADVPVSVLPRLDGAGLGFFSEASGWISVSPDLLRRYRADIPAAIAGMTDRLEWRGNSEPAALAGDDIWELGSARILRRGPLTEVWFARRVREEQVQKVLGDLALRRPPAKPFRVILTSTPADRLAGITLHGHIVVSVRDVLIHGGGLSVDPGIIAARISGEPDPASGTALYLSPDGRRLVINGTTIPLNSEIHRKIVAMLVAGHRDGRRYSARELLEAAGSGAGALHRAFGEKWTVLRPHLSSASGGWGFDL
jgi:hypothetical protein